MAGIPVCNNELPPNSQLREHYDDFFARMEVDRGDRQQYATLMRELTDLLGADCWAITFDDEVLYNAFRPPALARDRVLQDLVRAAITEDLHGALLHDTLLRPRHAVLRLYMYGSESVQVTVRIAPDNVIRVELRQE